MKNFILLLSLCLFMYACNDGSSSLIKDSQPSEDDGTSVATNSDDTGLLTDETPNTQLEDPLPSGELVAIDVLGSNLYQGHEGGLYPGGSNVPPPAHASKIQQASLLIRNAPGIKVMMSIGASNNAMEMNSFMSLYQSRTDKNPNVKLVNGSRGSEALEDMLEDDYLVTYVQSKLAEAGVNSNNVYAIWMKTCSLRNDLADFTFTEYLDYEKNLYAQAVTILKEKFPNLAIIYFTGRHTTKYMTDANGPDYRQHFEPRALYEQFSIKDLIASQINNTNTALNYSVAPVLVWANPFFTDGANPNSFGHTWLSEDIKPTDLLHPSEIGKTKTANYLMNFFSTNAYSKLWFLN